MRAHACQSIECETSIKYKTSIKYESSTKCLCGTNNMRDVQEFKLKYKTLVKCFLELNVFVNLVFNMRKLNVEYELTNVECQTEFECEV